jgi:hypothetical protein
MLAGEPVGPRVIAGAALRAREICAGFEAGVAVALSQAGNPHDGPAAGNEIARSIRTLLALGQAGLAVSGLHREGTALRLTVGPVTIQNMDRLLGAVILAAAHEPEVTLWDPADL